MGRRINAGCGPFVLQGFENYDINLPDPKTCADAAHIILKNAFEIDYAGAEIVFAGHFLEHQTVDDAHRFVRLVREKAPSATLILVVPVLERCDDPSVDFTLLQQIVSHHEMYPSAPYGIAHRSWWRTRDLIALLKSAGYSKVTEKPDCPYLVARVPWQVCLYAGS